MVDREQLALGDNIILLSSTKKLPIVLDCRNDYETHVDKFELAEPLGTQNF